MRTINVSKSDLMGQLVFNRDAHNKKFSEAFYGYQLECIKVLTAQVNLLQTDKAHSVKFNESPPQDHTADYNRVIAMLKMSVDNQVELTEQEFHQYVQDEWDWKRAWAIGNMKYTG